MGNLGVCHLCQKQKELIKKSHIIPRQFYHKMNEAVDKHFGGVYTEEKSIRIYSEEQKSKQQQSGLYVADILCKDCEQLLGKWDNYAQTLLLEKIELINDNLSSNESGHIEVNEIDYDKLKLFFMSVLWRSSIVKDKSFLMQYDKDFKANETCKFFEQIDLGEKWQKKLRNLLLQEQAGDENIFSVLLFKYKGIEANSVQPPIRCRKEVNHYRFRLASYCFLIKVDQRPYSRKIKEFIIAPNQPLKLRVIDYKTTQEYQGLLSFISDVKN
jgi:hypothetical protein